MDQLSELAKRLGMRAGERLDVERTTQAVLARLREPVRQRPTWVRPAILRIAAMIVVLIGGVVVLKDRGATAVHRGAAAHLVADDLDDLSNEELQNVLAGFDQLLDSTTAPTGADLNELDAQQLQTVLRSLEG
jgi:hypothetical protein